MRIRIHITNLHDTYCTRPWLKAVLWIRIRMDPELLSGSGIIVPDPDPAKYERVDEYKFYFSVNSGMCTVGRTMK